MKSPYPRITFLFGAGISIPAQMPSTKDITQHILDGQGIFLHSNGCYCDSDAMMPPYTRNQNNMDQFEFALKIINFMKLIKAEADSYYKRRDVNYEDLYYLVSQIRDSELGEYDNPAVQSFIDKIKANIEPLPSTHQLSKLSKLASEAANYIHDIVGTLLSKEPNSLDYLSFIGDACKDQGLGIDVFTLNHDTLLEQYFNNHKIKFTDGFDSPVNDVRYWKPEIFGGEDSSVRLFKLHGSVDWFRFAEGVGIPLDGDRWHSKNRNGEMQWPLDGRPEFLAGSFNKILQYVEPPYDDLLCRFLKGLRETSRLVICGYSFGDKAINTKLLDWVYSAPENKIVLIHPDPENLRKNARGDLPPK